MANPRTRSATSVILFGLVTALVVACGPTPVPAPAPPAPQPRAQAPATTAPTELALTGAVLRPEKLTVDQLAGMPSRTVEVTYQTERGPEGHVEVGVPLTDLLTRAGLALTAGKKHDELSFGVLAVGADGYQAFLSYGEATPDFGNGGVLLAHTEDGVKLARPRLVLPRDVKGGRYVSDLVELRVLHGSSL